MSTATVASLVGLTIVIGATVVTMRGGDGGEPFAVATIVTKPSAPIVVPNTAPALAVAGPDGGGHTLEALTAGAPSQDTQIENGVTVVRATMNGAAGPVTLKVPDQLAQKAGLRAPEPQLIEASATGPLPRIGRDGQRPASAYAAAAIPADGKPRIAILIGGMGLDKAATSEAAATLPAAVTFGFAPYGSDLDAQTRAVRAAGHEIVLQMPMEDFGRGDRPFPHMLKVGDGDNAANLRWLLSRFAGYAGVGNYLGGRLLADEEALKPLLKDVAERGLFFVDDGTAPRSLAGPVGQDQGVASLKADVVIDAASDPAAVAAALARLERLGRERGFAFGTASGRPATNTAIARFLVEIAKRGVVVVPVSQGIGLTPRVAPQASR